MYAGEMKKEKEKLCWVGRARGKTKTYNRRDSQMVTHSSTSRPVQCLCMAERTGCPVLTDLWSYVTVSFSTWIYTITRHGCHFRVMVHCLSRCGVCDNSTDVTSTSLKNATRTSERLDYMHGQAPNVNPRKYKKHQDHNRSPDRPRLRACSS